MMDRVRQFLGQKPQPDPAIPAGQRVYAVGDIHGRLDLFKALVAAIERDDAVRVEADTTLILLGDLIDRGPDSAGVVAFARALQARRKLRIVAGNHEEMFLRSFTEPEVLARFLKFGGRETILSYPVDRDAFAKATLSEMQAQMDVAVPKEDRRFIDRFEDAISIGDYLFVHAGIRPGEPADAQVTADLRWIREPFLSHAGDHGCVVVHGHTIAEEPVVRSNRIGIDTGAFMSGRLTALALQGSNRWLIEASDEHGTITAATRAA